MFGAGNSLSAALLALLVALTAPPSRATAAPLQTVRIQTIATDDATPILYAQKAGLFAKAGIDVQIERAGSGAAIAAAVLAGSFDIGLSNLVTLMSAHVRGVGFTLLAPAGTYHSKTPFSELVVAHDSTAQQRQGPQRQNDRDAGVGFALDARHLELGRQARRRFAHAEVRRDPDQRRASGDRTAPRRRRADERHGAGHRARIGQRAHPRARHGRGRAGISILGLVRIVGLGGQTSRSRASLRAHGGRIDRVHERASCRNRRDARRVHRARRSRRSSTRTAPNWERCCTSRRFSR